MDHLKRHEVEGTIEIAELTPGYPVISIQNKHASAKIALHGAHVIEYIPTGEKPVIFTSPDAVYKEGKAIRGGIPVCWPWFNAHPTDSSKPAHGFARNAFWELFRSSNDDKCTTLIFTYSKDDLHAELHIEVADELSVSLKTTNTGDTTETVGGALHSYFTISSIDDITIAGLENTPFHDSLTGLAGNSTEEITISEEVDRVYKGLAETVVIKDHQWKREISIKNYGSKSTVVWNPWIDKSATMGDLGNEDYKEFVCVETANAHEDIYHLAPGSSHTMATKISSKQV